MMEPWTLTWILWKALGIFLLLGCIVMTPIGLCALYSIFFGWVDDKGNWHSYWERAAHPSSRDTEPK